MFPWLQCPRTSLIKLKGSLKDKRSVLPARNLLLWKPIMEWAQQKFTQKAVGRDWNQDKSLARSQSVLVASAITLWHQCKISRADVINDIPFRSLYGTEYTKITKDGKHCSARPRTVPGYGYKPRLFTRTAFNFCFVREKGVEPLIWWYNYK